MLGVNLCHLGAELLQTVDETAQSPGPHAVGAIVLELRIETVEVVLTALVMAAELSVVVDLLLVEVHDGDGTVVEELARQCQHARTNHEGVGRLSHLGIAYLGLQAERASIDSDKDDERVALHACHHLTVIGGGLGADAVVLNHVADVTAATRPVGETLDTLQRIGQLADDGQLVDGRHLGSLELCPGVLNAVDEGPRAVDFGLLTVGCTEDGQGTQGGKDKGLFHHGCYVS